MTATLHPRLQALLQREFVTIKGERTAIAMQAVQRVKAEYAARGTGRGTPVAFAIDAELAAEYRWRADAYLARVLQRMSELGEPWSDQRRIDALALIKSELATDWNWIMGVRRQQLGDALASHSTLQIDAAKGTSDRRIEEELEARVLREERHRLPLCDLLSAPRYEGALNHWRSARMATEAVPAKDADAAREAVHAVEAVARLAAGGSAKTLGDCLKDLRGRTDDAGRRLLECVEEIWNFANVAPSVRHGGRTGDPVQPPEARFVVGVAEQALRLLLTYDAA